MKVKSQKQAHLFGAVAGGVRTKAKGLSVESAKKHLKHVKVKSLSYGKQTKKKGGK